MASRQFDPDRTKPPADFWLSRLIADGQKKPLPPSIKPKGEGGKFTTEGAVEPYPGNTFICHIDKASPEFAVLCDLQDRLKALPAAGYFTFLPQSSLHMTVFCGVSGVPLFTDGWPQGLPRDLPLATVNTRFAEAIAPIRGFDGVTVRADHLKAGYSIHAEPADSESFDALWRMRDLLRDATGLVRDDHDSYQFHISFAYRIRRMPREMADDHIRRVASLFDDVRGKLQAIRLGPVEFCTFETMHHFELSAFLHPEGLMQA
ncbi:DUF1868 domain-containing protein [Martelella mediterranea]|uniref:DUF1868 domain-containing protein n=1 Tax=uncultured Martelella sp. TaxID=392331 RepID=UPI000D05E8A9|nr:DUF1868 domain-containing protein [uncultured Martelella sp.]